MISRRRQVVIDRMRPRDADEAREYDERHRMYDAVGEEYAGQRFGIDGVGPGPLPEEVRDYYEEEE